MAVCASCGRRILGTQYRLCRDCRSEGRKLNKRSKRGNF